MKTPSTASLFAPAAVALGVLLLAPIHPAAAGGGNGAKATLGTKITTGVRGHPGAVGKLQCVGPYCPQLGGAEYKATTTGTYKQQR